MAVGDTYIGSVNIGPNPKWQLSIELYDMGDLVGMIATIYESTSNSNMRYDGSMGEGQIASLTGLVETKHATTMHLAHNNSLKFAPHPVYGYVAEIGKPGTYSNIFPVGDSHDELMTLLREAKRRLDENRACVN
jgi:hypothetical protein